MIYFVFGALSDSYPFPKVHIVIQKAMSYSHSFSLSIYGMTTSLSYTNTRQASPGTEAAALLTHLGKGYLWNSVH